MKKYLRVILVLILMLCMSIGLMLPASAATTPLRIEIQDFQSREIIEYTISAGKEYSDNLKITGAPQLGLITAKLPLMNGETPDLFFYMAQNNLEKSGKITANNTKDGKEYKVIEFEGAQCVSYEEMYDASIGYYIEIKLFCKEIKIGDYTYSRPASAVYVPENNGTESNTGSVFSTGKFALIVGIIVLVVAACSVVVLKIKKGHGQKYIER